jgi:hypothetical protein
MATDTLSTIETKLNKGMTAVVPSSTCCLAAKKLTTNDEAYKSLMEGLDVFIIKPDEGSKKTEKYRRCGRSVYGDGNEPLCWKHWEVRENPTFKLFKDVAADPSAVKADLKDFEAKAKKKSVLKPTKYNSKKLEAQPQVETFSFVIKKTPEMTAVFSQIQEWLKNPTAFTISKPEMAKATAQPNSVPEPVDNQEVEVKQPHGNQEVDITDVDQTIVAQTTIADKSADVDQTIVAQTIVAEATDVEPTDVDEVLSDISIEDETDLVLDDEVDEDEDSVSMDCLTTFDNVDYGLDTQTNEVWLVGDNGEGQKIGTLVETDDSSSAVHKGGKHYFICEEKKVKFKGSSLDMCFHTNRCYKNGKYIGKMENGVMKK